MNNLEALALTITCRVCGAEPREFCTPSIVADPYDTAPLAEQWAKATARIQTLCPARLSDTSHLVGQGARVGNAEGRATVMKRLATLHWETERMGEGVCNACRLPWPCPTMAVAVDADSRKGPDEPIEVVLIGGPNDGEMRHVKPGDKIIRVAQPTPDPGVFQTKRHTLYRRDTDDNGNRRRDPSGAYRMMWSPS